MSDFEYNFSTKNLILISGSIEQVDTFDPRIDSDTNDFIRMRVSTANTTTGGTASPIVGGVQAINGMIQALDNRVKTINNDMVKLDTLICSAMGIKPDVRRLSAADGKEDARKD